MKITVPIVIAFILGGVLLSSDSLQGVIALVLFIGMSLAIVAVVAIWVDSERRNTGTSEPHPETGTVQGADAKPDDHS